MTDRNHCRRCSPDLNIQQGLCDHCEASDRNAKLIANASRGIDLRDYFAAMALQGLVASNLYDRAKSVIKADKVTGERISICHLASSLAYEYADEMMAAKQAYQNSERMGI